MYNKEFDNIEIPENIDLYIKKGLKKAVNEKKSKKYRRNKFIKVVACASIMGALFLSFNSDSLANRMPFVKDVYKEIRNSKKSEVMSINFNEYFEDSAQEVNQTVTANGKTVTAESVLCDGKYIAISYIIKSEEKFERDDTMHQLLSNCKVKINNMTDYVFNSSGIEGVYTDDYTFVGTELLKLENKDSLPDEFNINIIFDNINAESFHRDKYYIPGDVWEFNFSVKSYTSDNKVIEVNETKSKFIVSSIEVRPLSLIVNHITPKDSEDTMYDILIYDDKGNEVLRFSEFYNDEGTNIGKTSVYRNLNRDCKYIKIVYEEMELIPNKKAPGTINIKKDDVEDVVFQINLK